MQEAGEVIEIRPQRRIKLVFYEPKNNNNVTEHESNQKQTLFFFHGSMATYKQYNSVINHFKETYRIVAYDALGCGSSDKPVDDWFGTESLYSVNNLLLDAIEVVKRYSTKTNILIGHSFGTTIVARIVKHFANDKSEMSLYPSIRCSVLLGTADHMPINRNNIFLLPVWVLELIHPWLSSGFADRAFSPSVDPEIKKQAMQFSGTNKMHVVKSFYNNILWADADIWEALINTSTLILQGIDDKITPVEKAQRLFDEYLCKNEKSKLIRLADAGHQVMQEKPIIVISHMESFISTVI